MNKRTLLFIFGLTVIFFLMHQWFDFGRREDVKYEEMPLPIAEETTQDFAQEKEKISEDFPEQEYYVLENQFQQLVFTNLNGALAEINLPFHSEKNPDSVVRKIGFDRIIQKDYPLNDHFPLYPYRKANENQKTNPKIGGYYPLLRRNLIGVGGKASTKIPPQYYGLNIISDQTNPETNIYTLKRLEKDLIEFELVEGNRRITKTFSFPQDINEAPYCIDVKINIQGDARGLLLTPGIPEVELISGSFTPALKYRVIRNQKSVIEEIKAPKDAVTFAHVIPNWICNGNGFFGIILDPLTQPGTGFSAFSIPGEITPTRLTLIDAQYQRFPASKYPGYDMQLPLNIKPGSSNFRIFAGPFDKKILQLLDRTFTHPTTGVSPNYISAQSYHGWFAFISQPFAKFLFLLMSFFYKITFSWGISIILLTIALRLMLYPLNSWSIKSTLRLQEIGPKVTAIQEKYKKDPNRAKLEVMNLYRKQKINPFGGCLPMLIQVPFLFGMFDLLKTSFELRGVPFIPGWINNLTAPDVLFSWKYSIVFIGNSFHLLPVLLGVIMYMQQKYTASLSKIKNATTTTDQQKQQKTMGNVMTIVFTVLFYNFPSGLNIYWISSMSLGILQQYIISKRTLIKPAK